MSENNQSVVDEQKEGYGSLECALAGQFQFSIGDVLKESWALTKGNKGVIWLSFVLYMVIYGIASVVVKAIFSAVGIEMLVEPAATAAYILPNFVYNPILMAIVSAPLTGGIWMLAIKIATNQPREATEVVKYFPQALKLFLTYLAMMALVIVGYCLFILPGIYLSIAYFLAMPLVVEKNMTIWQALETSRKAINHVWFSILGLFLVYMLMMIGCIFTLGIGFIWVLPLTMISYGVIYRIILGVENSVVVSA